MFRLRDWPQVIVLNPSLMDEGRCKKRDEGRKGKRQARKKPPVRARGGGGIRLFRHQIFCQSRSHSNYKVHHSQPRQTDGETDRPAARNFQRHRCFREQSERLLRPYGHYQEQQQSNSFVEWRNFHVLYSKSKKVANMNCEGRNRTSKRIAEYLV